MHDWMASEAFLVVRINGASPRLQLRSHLFDHLYTERVQMPQRAFDGVAQLLQLAEALHMKLTRQQEQQGRTKREGTSKSEVQLESA